MNKPVKTCAKVVHKKPQGVVYEIFFDKKSGLIGPGLRTGKKLFDCSEHERIVVFWKTGCCAAISPKKKRNLDKGIIKIFKYDVRRSWEKHFFCAYTDPSYGITDLDVFSARAFVKCGHQYQYISNGSEVLFVEDSPPTIYVKYNSGERFNIKQDVYRISSVDRMGRIEFEISTGRYTERLEKSYSFARVDRNILAAKPIECISLSVPDWLDPNEVGKESAKSAMRLDYE